MRDSPLHPRTETQVLPAGSNSPGLLSRAATTLTPAPTVAPTPTPASGVAPEPEAPAAGDAEHRSPGTATWGSPGLVRAGHRARLIHRATWVGVAALDATAILGAALLHELALSVTLVFVLLTLAGLAAAGSYRRRITPTVGEELPLLAGRVAVAAVVSLVVASGDARGHHLRAALVGLGLLCLGRALVYATVRGARRAGVLREPTIVAGNRSSFVSEVIRDHPEYGLAPVHVPGVNDPGDLASPTDVVVDQLSDVLAEGWIRHVVVADDSAIAHDLAPLLASAAEHDVEVHVLPRRVEGAGEVGGGSRAVRLEMIWGVPFEVLRPVTLDGGPRIAKRLFDLSLATLAVVVLAPVMVAAAIAVRLSGPGPILFRQRRVGQDGREVEILKFRTLPPNNDSDHTWSVDGSNRYGPVGRVLRRTSLDELPQFFNVLRGEMSIVGPRPERPHFVQEFGESVPKYHDRHRLPVGITGWAQIHQLRGDTSIDDRIRFDNYYIEHWSLWLDVVIVGRTVPSMARAAIGRSLHRAQEHPRDVGEAERLGPPLVATPELPS